MKKKLVIGLLGAFMCLTLCACSGDKDADKETKAKTEANVKTNVAVSTIIDNIKKDAKVSDFGKTYSKDTIGFIYLALDMNNVEEAAGLYIADDKIDEITVFKAKAGKSSDVVTAIKQRIEDQKEVSKQYNKEQYDRLCDSKNYVIKTEGDYVLLSISSDNDNVAKAFSGSLK